MTPTPSVGTGEEEKMAKRVKTAKRKEMWKPVNYPNPRFQLFYAKFCVNKYTKGINDAKTMFKKFLVYGLIGASDQTVSRKDGWVPLDEPMYRYALLFDHEWSDPITVKNTGFLPFITNPKTDRSVSVLSPFLDLVVELYAFNEEDQELFQVADGIAVMNLSKPGKVDTCINHTFEGDHGCLMLSFIVLTDAVDAALEIIFKKTDPHSDVCGKPVHVQIMAFYGDDFDYGYSPFTIGHYCVPVFQIDSILLLQDTKLALHNSVLAVPAKGSLIIDAYILDLSSGDVILSKMLKISAQLEGSSNGCIEGEGCTFELKVNWKYKTATT